MSKRHWNKRVEEIFQDIQQELNEIWAIYEIYPNDVMREEIESAVKDVKEKHTKTGDN